MRTLKRNKKRSGVALIVVLIIMMIVTFGGAAIFAMVNSESRFVRHQEISMKAYNAARTGAEAMDKWVTNHTATELDNLYDTMKEKDALYDKTDVEKGAKWITIDEGRKNAGKMEYKLEFAEKDSNLPSHLQIVATGKYTDLSGKVSYKKIAMNYQANRTDDNGNEIKYVTDDGLSVSGKLLLRGKTTSIKFSDNNAGSSSLEGVTLDSKLTSKDDIAKYTVGWDYGLPRSRTENIATKFGEKLILVDDGGLPTIEGDVSVKSGKDELQTELASYLAGGQVVEKNKPSSNYQLPAFPAFPAIKNKGNFIVTGGLPNVKQFNKTDFEESYNKFVTKFGGRGAEKFIINVPNKSDVVKIVTKELIMNKPLVIKGDGRVEFYVTDKLDINVGATAFRISINTDSSDVSKSDRLKIYYSGDADAVIGGNVNFDGSLYVQKAKLLIKPTHGTTGSDLRAQVAGNIITGGDVVVTPGVGSSEQYRFGMFVYAPNSTLLIRPNNEWMLRNLRANIYWNGGAVVKNLYLGYNVRFRYFPTYIEDFPFDLPHIPTQYTKKFWDEHIE